MSVDRKIDQLCPHHVREEFLVVQGDRQTVSPLRPIASADSVELRVNGLVQAPSFGVQVGARVVGTREGPFKITSATNQLTVQVNDDPAQMVTVQPSTQPPAKLASILTAQFQGLTFFVDRNRLGILSALSGREATFKILPSTLAKTLGLTENRYYRGKNTVPGWTLVTDPSTLSDRPRRLVYFDEPLGSASNFVELGYTTVREECRRCGGIGVENDWSYGADGQVITLSDESLLIQELLKITYTTRGSNPFHSWYGTHLTERIGSKNASTGVLQNAITTDIYSVFAMWQSIKRLQEGSQPVTDEEFPYRLTGVRIEQSQSDPTVIFVDITVTNRSLKPFTITRGLRLSEPVNLLTDTANQGVIRQSLVTPTLVG